MYEIKVKTKFAAAHNLRNYRGDCENVHGHNWKVEVTAAFDKLEEGMAMDFRELKRISRAAASELDHRNINDLPYFRKKNPTSENLARYLFDRIKAQGVPVVRVNVSETDEYTASYIQE